MRNLSWGILCPVPGYLTASSFLLPPSPPDHSFLFLCPSPWFPFRLFIPCSLFIPPQYSPYYSSLSSPPRFIFSGIPTPPQDTGILKLPEHCSLSQQSACALPVSSVSPPTKAGLFHTWLLLELCPSISSLHFSSPLSFVSYCHLQQQVLCKHSLSFALLLYSVLVAFHHVVSLVLLMTCQALKLFHTPINQAAWGNVKNRHKYEAQSPPGPGQDFKKGWTERSKWPHSIHTPHHKPHSTAKTQILTWDL